MKPRPRQTGTLNPRRGTSVDSKRSESCGHAGARNRNFRAPRGTCIRRNATAGPVSRILSARLATGRMAIPLGSAFLRCSSDLPGGKTRRAGARTPEAPLPPYLVLLRVGFALPAPLLGRRCALTAPFHPYPAVPVIPGMRNRNHRNSGAVCFLWHFPSTSL